MLNYFNHQLQSEITPLHSYNQVWPQKMCDFRNGSITACVFGFLGWNISETGSSGLSSEECFPVKNCEFWIRDIFWIQAWSAKGNSRNGNNQKKSTVGVIFESFCSGQVLMTRSIWGLLEQNELGVALTWTNNENTVEETFLALSFSFKHKEKVEQYPAGLLTKGSKKRSSLSDKGAKKDRSDVWNEILIL